MKRDSPDPAWQVAEIPGAGRGLVASRDLVPYQLVLRESTLVFLTEQDLATCVSCHQLLGSKEAGQDCECGMRRCTRPCGGGLHEMEECKELGELRRDQFERMPSGWLGFWRMLQWKEKDPAKWDDLTSLTSHQEERKKAGPGFASSVIELVQAFSELGVEVCEEDLSLLMGIVRTNSYMSSNGSLHLFLNLCLANHSCQPNCEHMLSEAGVVVRARRVISRGEELTMNYMDTITFHREFFSYMTQENWLFTCSCSHCKDPTELGTFSSCLKCQNCGVGFWVRSPGQNVICTTCELSVDLIVVKEKYKLLEELIENVESPDTITTIESLGSHPLHYLSIKLKIRLLEKSMTDTGGAEDQLEMDRRLVFFGEEVIRYLDLLDPGLSRLRGRVLYSLSRLKARVEKNAEEDRKNKMETNKMMNGYFKLA